MGVTFWLALPLLWFEQLMEGRFETTRAQIASTEERVGSTAERAVEIAEEARTTASDTKQQVDAWLSGVDRSDTRAKMQAVVNARNQSHDELQRRVVAQASTEAIRELAESALNVGAYTWRSAVEVPAEPPLGYVLEIQEDGTITISVQRDRRTVSRAVWAAGVAIEDFAPKLLQVLSSHGLIVGEGDEQMAALPEQIARTFRSRIRAPTHPDETER